MLFFVFPLQSSTDNFMLTTPHALVSQERQRAVNIYSSEEVLLSRVKGEVRPLIQPRLDTPLLLCTNMEKNN